MLEKLSIRNFRLFEELEVEGLKRVNLIVGKNNTGKTTLLEAIRVLEARGHSTVVNNILKIRGQFTPSWDESYYALYPSFYKNYPSITINGLVISPQGSAQDTKFKLIYPEAKIDSFLSSRDTPDFPRDEVINIPFSGQVDFIQSYWDQISLTDLEDEVIKLIKDTIEPRLIRLDISGGVAKIRLKNETKPLPLASLGDGAQRVLLIALALVNAKKDTQNGEGKMILIDELESGLHFSILEKLWEFIFEYAKKWNIQLFVTTHSSDTVNSFSRIMSNDDNQGEGFLFRLQYNREKKLEIIPYQIERLEKALEMDFEIR